MKITYFFTQERSRLMWDNKVLKQKAKERMKVNYWKMLLVGLIIALVSGGTGASSSARDYITGDIETTQYEYNEYYDGDDGVLFDGALSFGQPALSLAVGGIAIGIALVIGAIAICLGIFVLNPLLVGARRFFYQNINQKAELKELGYAFDRNYLNSVKTMFLRELYTFLWTLLFVIPGIVKSYEYRMVPYLLAENPNMSSSEAFATSKRMMDGNKLDAFWFDLTFIGWEILGVITFGIVDVFWVNGYYNQSAAMLYDAIKIGEQNRRMQQETTADQGFDQY